MEGEVGGPPDHTSKGGAQPAPAGPAGTTTTAARQTSPPPTKPPPKKDDLLLMSGEFLGLCVTIYWPGSSPTPPGAPRPPECSARSSFAMTMFDWYHNGKTGTSRLTIS